MSRPRGITVLVVAAVVALGVWFVAMRGPSTVDPTGTLGSLPGTALLVPGHGGNGASLQSVASAMEAAGWTTQMVDIGDGTGDINVYGGELATLARSAALASGPVVLVGYSEGGLIARAAIAAGAGPYVARVVTIATPHQGASIAGLGALSNSPACDTACRQMAPGSDFLDALPIAGDAARWLAVYSESDDVVRPADSAALDGATVVPLQQYCVGRTADHGQVVRDPFVVAAVVAFATDGTVPSTCS